VKLLVRKDLRVTSDDDPSCAGTFAGGADPAPKTLPATRRHHHLQSTHWARMRLNPRTGKAPRSSRSVLSPKSRRSTEQPNHVTPKMLLLFSRTGRLVGLAAPPATTMSGHFPEPLITPDRPAQGNICKSIKSPHWRFISFEYQDTGEAGHSKKLAHEASRFAVFLNDPCAREGSRLVRPLCEV
jgi:hypothetical protein